MRPVPTGIELVIIGGGNMGAALVGGLLAGGRPPSSIAVTEVAPARREQLAAMLPEVHVSDDVAPCAAAVLAVKPAVVAEAARAAVAAGARRLLSIAAGITTTHIEQAIDGVTDEAVAVVRAMPNTPALVGRGASAIAPGAAAGADDLEWAEAILGAVGLVVRVDESQLDAVTALSGSGPAYLFLVAEALTAAGVAVGLRTRARRDVDDATARRLRRAARGSRRSGPPARRGHVTRGHDRGRDRRARAGRPVGARRSRRACGRRPQSSAVANLTNGDVFCWDDVWPVIAATFGLEVGERRPMSFARDLPARDPEWAALAEEHNLDVPPTIEGFVGANSLVYADMVMAETGRSPFVNSTIAARAMLASLSVSTRPTCSRPSCAASRLKDASRHCPEERRPTILARGP